MIKKYGKQIRFANKLIEYVILLGTYFLATYIRFDLMHPEGSILDQAWNRPCITVAAVASFILIMIYDILGHYKSARASGAFTKQVMQILYVNSLGVIILYAGLYVTRLRDFSRLALLFFVLLSFTLLLIKRLIIRNIAISYRSKGFNLRHVLVVGNGHLAKQFIESTKKNKSFGIVVTGYTSKTEKEGLGKRLGDFEDTEAILDQNPDIEEVIVALESHEMNFVPYIISAADKQGVKVSVIPSYNDYMPANPQVDVVGNTKLINIRLTPLDDPMNAMVKRLEDIISSLLLIIIFSPALLICTIGTKLSSPGPIFFKQERMGRGKKNFTMLKFRSMKVNSESDTAWSTNVDDRRTKFGSFIRKCSLDEIPQFFNVLKGDMSLIGPRPELPHHVEHFKEEVPKYLLRQQVRPGITGWAQVNGLRGDTSIEDRIEYDLWYIQNWSLSLDIRIIFMTAFGGMLNDEKTN